MKKVWNFIKVLLGLVVVLTVVVYIFNLQYLVTAIRNTILRGHSTAFLEDYKYLPTRLIDAGTLVDPWSVSKDYNKAVMPRTLEDTLTNLETTAFLVIKKDSIWYERYFDGYDKDTKSNSFSMAKSIVVAALGKAIELGYITSLQEKVIYYLPELKGEYRDSLKIIDLARMSSGLHWDETYYSPFSITTKAYFDRDLRQVMYSLPIDQMPGQEFIYKSGDTQLLAMVLEEATGKNLSEFVSDYFWKPMGAENPALWQLDSSNQGIEKAFCCFTSNARDFARFGKLYLQDGKWNDEPILDSLFIKQSITKQFEDSPEYGLGWWLVDFQGKQYYYMRGHLGQFVIVDPVEELIIVRLGHKKGVQRENDPHSDDLYIYLQGVTDMIKNHDVK
ncbi:serine hydrolase domain-containing protein [Myroides sp. LJL115]